MQIQVAEPDLDQLADSVGQMLRARRPAAARPLLSALKRLQPDRDGLALLESGLSEAEGHLEEAIAVLDAALAERPADGEVLKRRAGLWHRRGQSRAAIDDAAAAVIAAPRDAAAKALLGMLLIERGDLKSARACLAEATAAEPDNFAFRLAFAEAAERAGEVALAASLLAEAIERSPGRSDVREAAIQLALRHGDPANAERLAEAARHAGLWNATILRLLGQALFAQGRVSSARQWMAEAVKLAPADESLRHMAAAFGALPAGDRAPAEFVRAQCNAAARTFARTMIGEGNRVPGLIRAVVLAHVARGAGPVLDLGCGGGLAAVALSDLALGPFVGVDLSKSMLATARQWGLYEELTEADLVAFMAAERRAFPLILAADVLHWFGSLEPLFAAVRPLLTRGGRFIFSLDRTDAQEAARRGWILGPDGRYAHSVASCEHAALAAQLRVIRVDEEIVRLAKSAPVQGLIAVLGRDDDAA